MKIATSPFVYRGAHVFMPEKLGNRQEKRRQSEAALARDHAKEEPIGFLSRKERKGRKERIRYFAAGLTLLLKDRAGGGGAMTFQQEGCYCTSFCRNCFRMLRRNSRVSPKNLLSDVLISPASIFEATSSIVQKRSAA